MSNSESIRPLNHQRVVITRDADANQKFRLRLLALGADVVVFDSFEFESCVSDRSLLNEFKSVVDQDWLVFTSPASARYFAQACQQFGYTNQNFDKTAIACVGVETAKAVQALGLHVSVVPEVQSQMGLADLAQFRDVANLSIAILQAEGGRDDFYRKLKDKHRITSLFLYRKTLTRLKSDVLHDLLHHKPQWLVFFSPSAVQSLVQSMTEEQLSQIVIYAQIIAIGETTKLELMTKTKSQIHTPESASEDAVVKLMIDLVNNQAR